MSERNPLKAWDSALREVMPSKLTEMMSDPPPTTPTMDGIERSSIHAWRVTERPNDAVFHAETRFDETEHGIELSAYVRRNGCAEVSRHFIDVATGEDDPDLIHVCALEPFIEKMQALLALGRAEFGEEWGT